MKRPDRIRAALCGAVLLMLFLAAGCASGQDTATTNTTTTTTTTTTRPPTTTTSSTTTTTTEPPTTTVTAPDPVPIEEIEGWELVWHDEFDGDVIDPTNWTYDIGGWGWGNGEAQYYTSRPRNARVENGVLIIEAHQERFENSYYTSARMLTKGLRDFKYGRIEARLKVPAGAGLWPAFWMLGAHFDRHSQDEENHWPFVGEIDIMEYIGREPDLILGTIHGPGYSGALGLGKWNRQDYLIADDYHTYAIEWDYEGISWFYDGDWYHTIARDAPGHRDWVFDHEFFLILNLAVGGQFPGPIGLDVEFPVALYVDYVRVYQAVTPVEEATTG
ncbi:MAG: glycoside hydrolase family 16 protein [bacterium]|nr:glycoside hydrolase family 16 protein [bacterium]MDE0601112.1 glycoside hydrolase family 16 protein [bacterium]